MLETGGNDPEVEQWQFNTSDAFDPNLNVLYVNATLAEKSADIKKHMAKFLKLKGVLICILRFA